MWTLIFILAILSVIYYFTLHKRTLLGSWLMLYDIDNRIDILLNKSMDSGIKSIEFLYLEILIVFNDGSELRGWDANKYYAWLSEGTITINKKDYRWNNTRPSVETQLRLKRMIAKDLK